MGGSPFDRWLISQGNGHIGWSLGLGCKLDWFFYIGSNSSDISQDFVEALVVSQFNYNYLKRKQSVERDSAHCKGEGLPEHFNSPFRPSDDGYPMIRSRFRRRLRETWWRWRWRIPTEWPSDAGSPGPTGGTIGRWCRKLQNGVDITMW